MRKLTVIAALLTLSGCGSTETVYLRAAGGQTVQCGPYKPGTGDPALAEGRLRDCVTDYQRQGYQRTPGP